MEKFILALDQGTTSSRAILFNKKGAIVSKAQEEITQYFPKVGWVEHDPTEIWDTQIAVIRAALKKKNLSGIDISAIGITNQRETVVVWDKTTGTPIYNAIVWQDKRTTAYCADLIKQGKSPLIRSKTGLIIDSYFSATKVKWILDNVKGAREKAATGILLLGTIDTWLLWNLTSGEIHSTDVTNASRTLLFNIYTLAWDEELLALFDIPKSMLPKVQESSQIFGHTKLPIFQSKVVIAGVAGDQQAALFGNRCSTKGMVKITYGTGCFMLMNIGAKPKLSNQNLLTTVALTINGQTEYALEGSIFMGGAIVQWLRDGIKLIDNSSDIEALAGSVDSSEGVCFVPAFTGLGAPHWNEQARGTIFGLTRGSTDAHIARAAVESIAYQTMDVLKAMEADTNIAINELRVDGGVAINNMLMQFQADVLNTVTVRPKVIETSALGAAFLAGLATGFWKDLDEIQNIWEVDRHFYPNNDLTEIGKGIKRWKKAIKALEFWAVQE